MSNTKKQTDRLIRPTILYKESYIDANEEFLKEENKVFTAEKINSEFDSYMELVDDNEKGLGLPEQFDKQFVFWLIDEEQYIGRLIIRHRVIEQGLHNGWHLGYSIRPSKRQRGYGTLILKIGLQKAEGLGIKKIFLVCDSDNLPSKKILEKVGAHFEQKILQNKPEKKDRLEYSLVIV